jgi:hypothetical protein
MYVRTGKMQHYDWKANPGIKKRGKADSAIPVVVVRSWFIHGAGVSWAAGRGPFIFVIGR